MLLFRTTFLIVIAVQRVVLQQLPLVSGWCRFPVLLLGMPQRTLNCFSCLTVLPHCKSLSDLLCFLTWLTRQSQFVAFVVKKFSLSGRTTLKGSVKGVMTLFITCSMKKAGLPSGTTSPNFRCFFANLVAASFTVFSVSRILFTSRSHVTTRDESSCNYVPRVRRSHISWQFYWKVFSEILWRKLPTVQCLCW